MKWKTDKPTADIIVAKLTGTFTCSEEGRYALLYRGDKPYEHYVEDYEEVPYSAIEKWADLEEDETITDCNELEKELDKWRHTHFRGKRDDKWSGEYLERTSQLDLAHHFAKWQKEQMLKDAVDGEVCILSGGVVYTREKNKDAWKQYILDNCKNGDKVKIIIVNEI